MGGGGRRQASVMIGGPGARRRTGMVAGGGAKRRETNAVVRSAVAFSAFPRILELDE